MVGSSLEVSRCYMGMVLCGFWSFSVFSGELRIMRSIFKLEIIIGVLGDFCVRRINI